MWGKDGGGVKKVMCDFQCSGRGVGYKGGGFHDEVGMGIGGVIFLGSAESVERFDDLRV